jgi:hemerythrin superfamily protein
MPASQTARSNSTARRKARTSTPDAAAVLKAEHAAVQKLFESFEKARKESVKKRLAADICRELTIHARIEEEIFYPAMREALDEAHLLDEADVEHASAKALIAEIERGSPAESHWEATVKVLGEYIRHHVKEEEKQLFPQAKASEADLKELGARLAARRKELEQER